MRNSTKQRGSIDDYTIINQKENLSLGAVIKVADISKAERMLGLLSQGGDICRYSGVCEVV